VESQSIEVPDMKMQMIQFVSRLNLIQMKLMKVTYRMKNMMNKEFQHFVGSQLTEVRMMKMHLIQFVSILKLIQMKLMKVTGSSTNMMNKEYKLIGESKLDVCQPCTHDKLFAAAQCHHSTIVHWTQSRYNGFVGV
jgi:hypothetical protein